MVLKAWFPQMMMQCPHLYRRYDLQVYGCAERKLIPDEERCPFVRADVTGSLSRRCCPSDNRDHRCLLTGEASKTKAVAYTKTVRQRNVGHLLETA